MLWSKGRPSDSEERFDWRIAAFVLKVPMIRALFEELARPSVVGALDLGSVLERTGEVLNRVERGTFFENFDEEGAVQYFYEPFLEAFDPELRKQFGVWYTMPVRRCEGCGLPLPQTARKDQRHHNSTCRSKARHKRERAARLRISSS